MVEFPCEFKGANQHYIVDFQLTVTLEVCLQKFPRMSNNRDTKYS